MVRDRHVHNATALMGQQDQDKQESPSRSRHHEEVGRHDLSDMIRQERAPCL